MAQLDVSNFIIPEQKFEGIYKAGETIGAQRKAEAAAKAKADEEAKAGAKAMETMLSSMSQPKDYLSGAPTDPEVLRRFNSVYQKGLNLINENKGMNNSMLSAALFPEINKIQQYALTSKTIKGMVDKNLEKYNKDFYDLPTLKDEVYKKIYFNEDGTMKDLSEVQYDQSIFDKAIEEKGTDITKAAGIISALKGFKPIQEDKKTTRRDKSGRLIESTTKITRMPWEVVNEETGEFEPVSEIATDNGKPIMHEGQEVKVVPDDIYQQFIDEGGQPVQDWLNSQIKAHINEYNKQVLPTAGEVPEPSKLSLNSPQAQMVGKAVLYDLLYQHRSGKQFTGKKDMFKIPSTGSTFNFGGGFSGGGKYTGNVLDEFGKVEPLTIKGGKGSIKNGVIMDAQGSAYTSPEAGLYVPIENIPGTLMTILSKGGGIDLDELGVDGVNLIVKDGKIKGVKVEGYGILDRDDIFKFQQKYDSERKGEGMTFGAEVEEGKSLPVPTKSKTKTTKFGGKYSGNQLKISSYNSAIQAGIRAHMKVRNITEEQAIKELLDAKKITPFTEN